MRSSFSVVTTSSEMLCSIWAEPLVIGGLERLEGAHEFVEGERHVLARAAGGLAGEVPSLDLRPSGGVSLVQLLQFAHVGPLLGAGDCFVFRRIMVRCPAVLRGSPGSLAPQDDGRASNHASSGASRRDCAQAARSAVRKMKCPARGRARQNVSPAWKSSTMRAAGPATGPALAVPEVGAAPVDPARARFRFLGQLDPADPLIARERRDVLPVANAFASAASAFFRSAGRS